jgi:xylose isomerase
LLAGREHDVAGAVDVQVHDAAADPERLLLAGLAVDRGMPVLGTTLVREEDELLRAHAIRVHVDHDLQPDFVESPEPEVRDLDLLALDRRQHDSRLGEHRCRAFARFGLGHSVILGVMKTSLGIWAFGSMATRFVPGGYKPELANDTTVQRVRRAVEGLEDLIDGYEFHYPQELSEENLDEVRDALDGHDIYCLATGLHLDARFGRGGLTSPDSATRAEALKRTLAAIDFSGELGAHFIIWPGIEGYNYPFQTPYSESWAWFVEGIGQAAERCRERGILLFLEHKNSEPAMKILMRNIGMTLHVIHKLRAQGLDNVKVNMDWQHLLMNGESLAECAGMLAAEGLLGHQHANSGWGTFDDDNMVGALAFMETLELAVELRRAGYGDNGERLGFDLYPYTEDAVAAVKRSVLQWRFIDDVASRIDDAALRAAQAEKDAVAAYEVVYAALGG